MAENSPLNYYVIPGRLSESSVFVNGAYGYTVNKTKTRSSGSVVKYLKCKFQTCKATAIAEGNALLISEKSKPHTCQQASAGNDHHWRAEYLKHRMRTRASSEATSLQVSCIL